MWVSGVIRQNGVTKVMTKGTFHFVWRVSPFRVLRSRDVTNTGLLPGGAFGRLDLPYLRASYLVAVAIKNRGSQWHPIGLA